MIYFIQYLIEYMILLQNSRDVSHIPNSGRNGQLQVEVDVLKCVADRAERISSWGSKLVRDLSSNTPIDQ